MSSISLAPLQVEIDPFVVGDLRKEAAARDWTAQQTLVVTICRDHLFTAVLDLDIPDEPPPKPASPRAVARGSSKSRSGLTRA